MPFSSNMMPNAFAAIYVCRAICSAPVHSRKSIAVEELHEGQNRLSHGEQAIIAGVEQADDDQKVEAQLMMIWARIWLPDRQKRALRTFPEKPVSRASASLCVTA